MTETQQAQDGDATHQYYCAKNEASGEFSASSNPAGELCPGCGDLKKSSTNLTGCEFSIAPIAH